MNTQEASVSPPAPPKFVEEHSRTTVVNLDWPIEFDGKVFRSVQISRMTVRQIEKFFADYEELNARDPEAAKRLRFPMFSAPDAVLDALDDDDHVRIQEAAQDFLPLRFRELTSAPALGNGEGSPSP